MKRKTNDEFIKESINKHGIKYDYSKVDYIGNKSHVIIVCPTHGEFTQAPIKHLLADIPCLRCSYESRKKNFSDFISECHLKHNNKYDYSKCVYVDYSTKMEIICVKHGSFWQTPKSHLGYAHGCSSCNESRGEKYIRSILDRYNISYNCQHRFDDCKSIRTLPFDFYIQSLNMCIEFDGLHHYEDTHFHKVADVKKHDEIKNTWCKNNNIKLLRISYLEKENFEQIFLNF